MALPQSIAAAGVLGLSFTGTGMLGDQLNRASGGREDVGVMGATAHRIAASQTQPVGYDVNVGMFGDEGSLTALTAGVTAGAIGGGIMAASMRGTGVPTGKQKMGGGFFKKIGRTVASPFVAAGRGAKNAYRKSQMGSEGRRRLSAMKTSGRAKRAGALGMAEKGAFASEKRFSNRMVGGTKSFLDRTNVRGTAIAAGVMFGAAAGVGMMTGAVDRLSRNILQHGTPQTAPRATPKSKMPTFRRNQAPVHGNRIARSAGMQGSMSSMTGQTVLQLHQTGGRGAVIR